MPEPRFQATDFPYRSSYMIQSEDGVHVSTIKILEQRVDISKKTVSRKVEALQETNLLVTVFETKKKVGLKD